VLQELQTALPGLTLSQKALTAMQKKEYWINKLIEADVSQANEQIQMREITDSPLGGDTSPYDWV
jgi:hypothetical protein